MLKTICFFLVVLALGYALIEAAGLPFVFVAALMFVVPNYVAYHYNARRCEQTWPIPECGYERRREDIERDEHMIFNLGFDRVDEFHQKASSNYIAYCYKHTAESVFLIVYHFGVTKGCDFITFFRESDATLTTSPLKSGGMMPRPPQRFLQLFPDASYAELFDEHRRSLAFLRGRGLTPLDHPAASFRGHVVRFLREFYDAGVSVYFKLPYWFLMDRAARYCKPLEEQRVPLLEASS